MKISTLNTNDILEIVFRKSFYFLVLVFILSPISVFAQEKLIFTVDLIRHGDRTPASEIPKSPYPWKEGLGELTALGMQQEYQLGVHLRKKYIDKAHLLPTHYSSDSLYVASTDVNRTLMSAQSFLLGLYPLGTGPLSNHTNEFALPEGFQPIPIHTENDLLLIKPSTNPFALIRMWCTQHNLNKNCPLKDKFKQWSLATGMNIKNDDYLDAIADTLYIRKLHHIPLPSGISQQDADEIISIDTQNWLDTFKKKDISYPTGHKFLLRLAAYFNSAIANKAQIKSVFFFGHDGSILAVMNTLGIPLDHWPGYAEDLNFSLYKNENNYFVKISINDKPVSVPVCNGSVCSLSQFLKLINQ